MIENFDFDRINHRKLLLMINLLVKPN